MFDLHASQSFNMSSPVSAGDIILAIQLASRAISNCRKASGEYATLVREVTGLQSLLQRLQTEIKDPHGPINKVGSHSQKELAPIFGGCEDTISELDKTVRKYQGLKDPDHAIRRQWQKVRFGNTELANLKDLKSRITYHASLLSLFLNMLTTGGVGRIEKQMNDAGGDLREIRIAVNGIAARQMAESQHEGSVLTSYVDDEQAVWRQFRRELVQDGFKSSIIHDNMLLIQGYVKELGARGVLDEQNSCPPNTDRAATEVPDSEGVSGPSRNQTNSQAQPSHSMQHIEPAGEHVGVSAQLSADPNAAAACPHQRDPLQRQYVNNDQLHSDSRHQNRSFVPETRRKDELRRRGRRRNRRRQEVNVDRLREDNSSTSTVDLAPVTFQTGVRGLMDRSNVFRGLGRNHRPIIVDDGCLSEASGHLYDTSEYDTDDSSSTDEALSTRRSTVKVIKSRPSTAQAVTKALFSAIRGPPVVEVTASRAKTADIISLLTSPKHLSEEDKRAILRTLGPRGVETTELDGVFEYLFAVPLSEEDVHAVWMTLRRRGFSKRRLRKQLKSGERTRLESPESRSASVMEAGSEPQASGGQARDRARPTLEELKLRFPLESQGDSQG